MIIIILIIWSLGFIINKVDEIFYCWVIVWHIGVFHVILTFVKRLILLICSQRISYLGTTNIDNSSINDRQLRLIFVATKMCLISQTITMIGIIYFTQEFIFGSIKSSNRPSVYNLIQLFITIFILCVDNTIVFMAFGMNRNWYICICGICHSHHQKLYEKMVIKKMRKDKAIVAPSSSPVADASPISDEQSMPNHVIEAEELRR